METTPNRASDAGPDTSAEEPMDAFDHLLQAGDEVRAAWQRLATNGPTIEMESSEQRRLRAQAIDRAIEHLQAAKGLLGGKGNIGL